ncbi:MAG TPA: hypothetical protein VNO79_14305 [Actinomycetota bacterium]|nr:hypothetical protein [Actinomycetota bacterium]
MAEALGRSVRAVQQQAHRQRISLRPPGERRGTVLGQPRGVSLRDARRAEAEARALAEARERVLRGELDPALLDLEVRRGARIARGDPLCPSCSRAPQETIRGFCRDCHLRELARAHRERAPERALEARREWDRERQRAKRRRDAEAPRSPDA